MAFFTDMTRLQGSLRTWAYTRGGQRTKARQSDLNVLMDKGRPSKIFRDQERGYGKDLFALYRQTRDGTKPHKVQLLQISGINARDADRILRDDDVIAASREQYLFFTAPVMNPYALPPAHVQLPTEVLQENGELSKIGLAFAVTFSHGAGTASSRG